MLMISAVLVVELLNQVA